jgi:hypothetical protein
MSGGQSVEVSGVRTGGQKSGLIDGLINGHIGGLSIGPFHCLEKHYSANISEPLRIRAKII